MSAAAESRAGICLMHMLGEPRTMQEAPRYDDVVADVGAFLAGRLAACRAAGIDADRLAIDPGFGFGKTVAHNLALLKHLSRFESLGAVLAVGLSRKSMLAKLTGRAVDDRIAGSVALAAIAVLNGARIVRAHDVAATLDAVRVAAATLKGEQFDGT
jgi:dihydropteroate synthase